jgi:hypothetical protein
MKTEVYSWRMPSELKSHLMRRARIRRVSIADILDNAVRDWLRKDNYRYESEPTQCKLHAAAALCFGTLAGGDSNRSEKARAIVRRVLSRKSR